MVNNGKLRILPIAVGELDTDESVVFAGGSPSKPCLLHSYVFLVQVRGETFLVDAGMGDFPYCAKYGKAVCRPHGRDIADVLYENGVSTDKVQTLVLTHCHWDHIGGLPLFPNATIYCQREEYESAMRDSDPDSGQYPLAFEKYLLDAAGRFHFVDGDYLLNPYTRLIKTGAHSVGSQIVAIDDGEQQVYILGDEVFYYKSLLQHIPVGCTQNPEKSAIILEKIIARMNASNGALTVYPGHDPQAGDRPITN